MDLTTTYMGLELRSPVVVSACPLSDEISSIRQMEDAGAAAVVLYSLFEEELRLERFELEHHMTHGSESFPEALTYFPEPDEVLLGPEQYLEHIRRAKEAVDMPIIASLNGASVGKWTEYAKHFEEAGADALELNIYYIPTKLDLTGEKVEQTYLDILKTVRSHTSLPIGVKLSPFFSNMANMAKRLDEAGAAGLVLFNRFYQPDIDLENLEVMPNLILSTAHALRLPLRWIAILYQCVGASLAATSGIHTASDVLKLIMVGADVAMLCSVLFKRGIGYIAEIENSMKEWMEEHEYDSVKTMRGSLSQINCPDPAAYERAQYMRTITRYWEI